MYEHYQNPDGVRYFLAAWTLASAILALVGNLTVIAAAYKNIIKLDKVTVGIIVHLALSDIGYTLSGIVTTFPAILLQRWPFGYTWCVGNKCLTNIFYTMSTLLVSLFSINKLFCFVMPFHARYRSTRTCNMILSLIWVLVTAYAFVTNIYPDSSLYFNPEAYQCWINYKHHQIFGSIMVIWVCLMGVIIICTTLALLVFLYVHRSGVLPPIKGTMAIVSVSLIYVLSSAPGAIVMALKMAERKVHMSETTTIVLNIVTTYIFYIGTWSNPIVYFFSIRSYGNFIKRCFFKLPEREMSRSSSGAVVGGQHRARMITVNNGSVNPGLENDHGVSVDQDHTNDISISP